ncbi:S-layer homology domain-containing protein [Cohnella rhizosphaerae]|uniref:S-layer homology domain-containing protein n=1 Tax=Cohnella rhizosphaerae TaxID=1457232 RepID=A0A9X4KU31_9BACL|nr:S-layer homology domain-containing protein [Cohnella rhizosphaerae]MDG0810798.1 S-layer homology domain-containing protein [Cohnella rhizosphaerae]
MTDRERGMNAVKKYVAAVMLWIFALSPAAGYAAAPFELAVSAKEVLRGGTITLSGTGAGSGAQVALKIVSPAKTTFYVDVLTAANGSYAKTLTIPSDPDLAPYGTYTVIAGYGSDSAQKTFAVVDKLAGGNENPGNENPGNENPGNENPGSNNPGNGNPGTAPANGAAIPAGAGKASGSVAQPELTQDGRYIVGADTLDAAIKQPGGSVTIELPAAALRSGTPLELPASSFKSLSDNNRELVLSAGDVTIRLPAGAISASGDAQSKVRLTLNTSLTDDLQGRIDRLIRTDASFKATGVILSVDIRLLSGSASSDIHDLGKQAMVTIKLTAEQAAAISRQTAGVYYLNGEQAEYVGGTVSDGIFTFKPKHFSTYAVLHYDKRFVDLSSHWSEPAVRSLAAKHIVTGVDATHYEPSRSITRAEFATILMRAVDWKGEAPTAAAGTAQSFKDVAASQYYAEPVAMASALGILSGYGGAFRPNDKITREEAAVALVRAAKYFSLSGGSGASAGKTVFADQADISAWATAAVEQASTQGLMQGDGKRFNPNNPVVRAEAAAMIDRLLPVATN